MFTSAKAAGVALALAALLAMFTRATHISGHAASPNNHAFVPPGPTDSRSPCPALNALANHGYLPHDGKDISPFDLARALREVYNLDGPLAHFLAFGGFWFMNHPPIHSPPPQPDFKHPLKMVASSMHSLREALEPHAVMHTITTLYEYVSTQLKYPTMDLNRLGLHDHVEHDASVTHDDSLGEGSIAPWASNRTLFDAFLADSHSQTHIDLYDLAKARVRREKESRLSSGRTLDPLHALIARGEAALVISIFGEPMKDAPAGVSHFGKEWSWDGLGVPFETMNTFWYGERIPDGWKPTRVTAIHSTHNGNDIVGKAMDSIRARELSNAPDGGRVGAEAQQVLIAPDVKR